MSQAAETTPTGGKVRDDTYEKALDRLERARRHLDALGEKRRTEPAGDFGALARRLLALHPPGLHSQDEFQALRKFVGAVAELEKTGTLTTGELNALVQVVATLFVQRHFDDVVRNLFGPEERSWFLAASGARHERD